MELAVKVVFQFTARAALETLVFSGSKSSRKTVPQSGASPQLAESLIAGARPIILEMNNHSAITVV